jgi:hypothetical protein
MPLVQVHPQEPLAPTLSSVSDLLTRIEQRPAPRVAVVWVSDTPVTPTAADGPIAPAGAPASVELSGRWRIDWLEVHGDMADERERLIAWIAATRRGGGVLWPVVGRTEPWRDVRRALRRWRGRHASIVGPGFVADNGRRLSVGSRGQGQ